MKINLCSTAFMILVAVAFLLGSDRGESLDITTMVQGTVKEIKTDSIKILQGLDGKEVQIAINANTVYDGVQALTDLKVGDKVQIGYQTDHHKNIAFTITKMETENG